MREVTAQTREQLDTKRNTEPWLELWRFTVASDDVATQVATITNIDDEFDFDGETYRHFPLARSDYTEDSDGNLADMSVTLSNVDRDSSKWSEIGQGFTGLPVEWIIVHRAHLALPENALRFAFTSRSPQVKDETISLDLSTNPFYEFELPQQRFGNDRCGWVYRGPQCRYTGPLGACLKTWDACNERDVEAQSRGVGSLWPMVFGGFLGLAKGA